MSLILISFLIPASFDVLGARVDPMRLSMLVGIIPFAIMWLSRKAGPLGLVDFFILGHASWMVVALIVNEGVSRFPYAAMLAIELFCGFLVGRMLVRNAAAYRALFATMIGIFIFLTPFVIYELMTGDPIMQFIANSILGSSHGDVSHPPRMGFYRVQSVMQHPILFGVFCSVAIANVYYIWKPRPFAAVSGAGLALWLTFSSLSSGALLAGMFQVGMIVWDKLSKGAWKIVIYTVAAVYVFLSVASNRGPIVIMIETLTFNADTGWYRIHQWRHGIDDAKANPIFGIGLGDWSRPYWLSDSIDNFWLLTAMRYGIVGFLLLALGVAWHIRKVAVAGGLTEEERRLRTGYLLGLVSLCLSLATVHVWGPPYVLFMLYVGAGVWFYGDRRSQAPADGEPHQSPADPERDAGGARGQASSYSRFGNRSTRPIGQSRPKSRAHPTTGRIR